jgi:hypothetical protein
MTIERTSELVTTQLLFNNCTGYSGMEKVFEKYENIDNVLSHLKQNGWAISTCIFRFDDDNH